jgi:GNAT superfamily N-acetyltransferase
MMVTRYREPVELAGPEYLHVVTAMLQRIRLAEPSDGPWEAADLQWWWRRDQHPDPANARFWLGGDGAPVAAVVFTDWGDRWGCELLARRADESLVHDALWPWALQRATQLSAKPVDVAVVDDDLMWVAQLTDAGFVPTDDVVVECWMATEDRPAITSLADGYRLSSRAIAGGRPHHMIKRSGPFVADRLRECSLYRAELDLFVEAADGDVAAYGLFWADPVTGVGLVEPMRTEDDHQNRGLARHVLTAGLDLLASRGCHRLKIGYVDGNEAARRVYLDTGFRPRSSSRTYRLAPHG